MTNFGASFPLGKPIAVMIAVAVVSGVAISLRPPPQPADLEVWTFADAHARVYRDLSASFLHPHPPTVRIETVPAMALNMRLSSLFSTAPTQPATTPSSPCPDAVEIEISSIARYFRAPPSEAGFLPLNHYLSTTGHRTILSLDAPGQHGWNARLASDGRIYTYANDTTRWQLNSTRTQPDTWIDRIVPSRFAPWTKAGRIFGVPHDVHPVTLTYRHDLFIEAGVDLPTATTWPHFHALCLQFQTYWRAHGHPNRYAMELPLATSDNVVVMLLQRGVNLVDSDDRIHVTDPKVAQTIAFYAQLVAGKNRIGIESAGGLGVWARDLLDGNTCALVTPDWKINDLKTYAPELSGKLRMMPLPVFDPTDAPTSTWGGTMIGIPRGAKNPDLSWKLIEHLYLSAEARTARRAHSTILPPLPEDYALPDYHWPDPYFGGQPIEALYASLAPTIPPRYVSPLTVAAQIAVSVVLSRAVDEVREHNPPPAQLEAQCAAWLKEMDKGLRERLAHGRLGANNE